MLPIQPKSSQLRDNLEEDSATADPDSNLSEEEPLSHDSPNDKTQLVTSRLSQEKSPTPRAQRRAKRNEVKRNENKKSAKKKRY